MGEILYVPYVDFWALCGWKVLYCMHAFPQFSVIVWALLIQSSWGRFEEFLCVTTENYHIMFQHFFSLIRNFTMARWVMRKWPESSASSSPCSWGSIEITFGNAPTSAEVKPHSEVPRGEVESAHYRGSPLLQKLSKCALWNIKTSL